MAEAVLSPTGYIRLPPATLQHLGVHPGDHLDIRILEDGRVVMARVGSEWGDLEKRGAQKVVVHGQKLDLEVGAFNPHRMPRHDVPLKVLREDFAPNDPDEDDDSGLP